MRSRFYRLALLGTVLLAFGCETASNDTPDTLTADLREKIDVEVKSAVAQFFSGMSAASCDDGTPVSDLVRDPNIYLLDDEVIVISRSDYEEGVKYRACNWAKHDGGVDSVLVDALAPNVATSAWTFHDIITQKDGSISTSKGAVLQTWVKFPEGWRIAATMSSEIPTSSKE
jgi:hypothetical protein